jgi:hypothetical protein
MLDLVNEREPIPATEVSETATVEVYDEVVEVPFLLSIDQLTALEKAAHSRGLTAAEMVRRLLGRFIANLQAPSCQAS